MSKKIRNGYVHPKGTGIKRDQTSGCFRIKSEAVSSTPAVAKNSGASIVLHSTAGNIQESSSTYSPPRHPSKATNANPATITSPRYTRPIMRGSGPHKLSPAKVQEVVWKVVSSRAKG